VPNTIGIGPIRRRPAPRPVLEPWDDRTAMRIVATTAKTNPEIMSRNPSSVTDGVPNFLTFKIHRVSHELYLFQISQKHWIHRAVIVYKRAEATSKSLCVEVRISWTSDPKLIIQAENLP
jgi:hypothetical protein